MRSMYVLMCVASVACSAEGLDELEEDAGAAASGGAGEGDPAPPVDDDACFVLDDRIYRIAARICGDQSKGSVPAACMGHVPSPKQCDPFQVRYKPQAEEEYYCCCDPRRSEACDFASL